MASGVAIDDAVIRSFQEIKVRHHGREEKEQLKLVVMRISDDQKSIIVDNNATLKVKDVENEPNVFKKVVSMLPDKDCRYALYDCSYEIKEGLREDLIFIMWAPDDAPMKTRMIYASSKTALRTKLPGLKFEWQVNDTAEKEMLCLAEKLGGEDKVKSIEGISL